MSQPVLLQHMEWDAARLAADFPPQWRHPHKQAVYDRILQQGAAVQGTVRFTRWCMTSLPEKLPSRSAAIIAEPGFFTYSTSHDGVWHLNFADPRLFAAYGSPLMAQDEWQVLEHPLLGSLREALLRNDQPALTRADGVSTPVLISRVPRQCALYLAGGAAAPISKWQALLGRLVRPAAAGSQPLYGNAFAKASLQEVMRALTVLNPPALSNILAIAAPTGAGAYTRKQITDILQTAFNGFAAAVLESRRMQGEAAQTEIHTGWWGCGAFGGNRTLTALLQIIAAQLAGVGRLVFHYGNVDGLGPYEEALSFFNLVTDSGSRTLTAAVLDEVEALNFRWGQSDGN